jgi:hypothetical protein
MLKSLNLEMDFNLNNDHWQSMIEILKLVKHDELYP